MKSTKYAFMTLVAMLVALTSCSDKGYWDGYTEDGVRYSFEQPTFNPVANAGDLQYTLNVVRSTKSGTASLPITVKSATEGFSFPASVNFEDGKNVGSFTFSVAQATPGIDYKAVIAMPEDMVSATGSATCTIALKVDYNWVSLGKGLFCDLWAFGETYWDVEILQAEGFKRYRVLEPYTEGMTLDAGEFGDWRTGKYPAYVEFWDAGDYLNWTPYSLGIVYQAEPGQDIVAYPGLAFKGLNNDMCQWYKEGYALLSPYYYIDGVGGWNNTTNMGVVQILFPGVSPE